MKLMMSPKFEQVFCRFFNICLLTKFIQKTFHWKTGQINPNFFSEFHFALKKPQPHKKCWTNLSNNLNPTKNSHEISFRQPQPQPKNSPTLRMTPLLIEGVFGSQKRATKKKLTTKNALAYIILYTPINIGIFFFSQLNPSFPNQKHNSRAETLKPAPSAVVVGSTGSSSSMKRSTYCRRAAASYNGETQAAGGAGWKKVVLWAFFGGSYPTWNPNDLWFDWRLGLLLKGSNPKIENKQVPGMHRIHGGLVFTYMNGWFLW